MTSPAAAARPVLPGQVNPPEFALSDSLPGAIRGVDVVALPVLPGDGDGPVLLGPGSAELTDELGNLKREAFNLRFQAATSQLEKPSRVREVRRDIARIKTLQSERNRSAAK